MESLTGPFFHHRRKLSNASSANSNGLSFSGKDAYDDVLLGGSKPRFGAVAGFASRKVAAEDYAEIFGGRNGTRGSSIPVLDLSDLDKRHGPGGFRSSDSKLDYSTIFGGFGGGAGGDDVAMAVPPCEELFNGVKKVKRDKAKARISTDPCPPLKGSDRFNSSEKNKSHSSEASEDFVDGGKQFNMSYHKTGQQRKDGSSGTTHIAQLHAVPGFTCIIDETARLQKVEQDKALSQVKAECNHKQGSFDHLRRTELDKAMPPLKAQVSHNQDLSDCLQKTEQDRAMPPLKTQVSRNQSSSDCLQKTEQDKAIPSVKSDVNHNRNCSDRQQKGEKDKAMPQVKLEVNHNRSSNVDISEEKSGRRAKWQLPTIQASESLVKDKGECYQDASNSSDILSNMEKPGMKSHPYNVPPPCSSSANLFDSKGHTNRSNSSKVEASEKVTGAYSTPFSDEELDVNSAAAAPAAALKKAIEQAQESIRIVKEIMERKRDSGQGSKLHSKGRLKTKDAREMKHVQELHNVREKNVNEACRSVDNEMLDSCGGDQYLAFGNGEVALPFKDCEESSTGQQGVVAINGENVEVAEENGVATWFSQLLSNGKHRVAALASELVGKRNSTIQTLDKEKHSIEEPKLVKVTVDLNASEKVNAVNRILESGDTEAKLNAFGRSEELKKNVDGSESSLFANKDKVSETQIFSQADEVTKNGRANLVEEQKCKEKHEDFNEKISEGHFEPEKLGNLLQENDFLKLEKRSSDQEGEEKLEDIHVCGQEDCKVDEEVDLEPEDFHLWFGNEHALKRATCCVCSRKGLEDDSEDRLEGYYKQETDGQRSTQSVNGEENQNMSEEEHVWEAMDRRSAGSCQSIEEDGMDEDADNSSVHQKIEVNEEVQEVGNSVQKVGDSWDRTVDSAENPGANLFQEAAYKESLDTDFDAYNNDQSVNPDDIQEACRSEVENCSEQNNQQERRNNEEEARKVGIPESFYEFEEDAEAPQDIEEASTLKGEEVHTMESGIRDVFEVVDFFEKTADFGFTQVNCEAELSKDAETAITTVFISNCTTEDTVDGEQANDAPSEIKDSSNFDFNMNGQKQIHNNDNESENSIKTESCAGLVDKVYGQKQSEEIDRGFESGINPANGGGLVHESGGNAESVHVDGIAHEKDDEKDTIELHLEERECIKSQKEPGNSEFPVELKWEEHVETNTEMKTGQSAEHNEENGCKTFAKEDKEIRENVQKEEAAKDCLESTEVNKREREQKKHRIAVERAIREARERAFAEARERAERAAVDKATAEVRQRAMAEAREKLEKKSSGPKVPTGKASSIDAKLRAERAAVERATAEARERALEKALSQKTTSEMRTQAERNASGKFSGASRVNGLKHSFSSSDLESFDGTNNESAQRRKARLERHQRIMERAAKALAEKNLRDVLAQREQAERNRLAETLDADIKRWASGKEGNLRALLSTLQYILGPNSGWQSISLTEIITTNALKKAYRKATLYVHPDKLQQRGASIQQKYICEKVFDLLKAAWNKFNSEER
ncbi:auxilin-like protein 1 [Coffea eugenioides]|uniref:auxilin-like protein 1 n=1 Tax=Coffea eugenioides TaxID=49369 RepID=UPI000F611A2A|nr:auxilin-like protein 1 [Coffea eugenioides]